MKLVIVDDEQPAISLLLSYCSKIPQLEVCATFEDPLLAMQYMNSHDVDVLISDIDMPGLNGIELCKSLVRPIKTIFVTAHDDFAVEGFGLSAIDYLLKPVAFPRFLQAINKISLNGTAITGPSKDYMFIKIDGIKKRVDIQEILFIEAQGDYLKIKLKDKHYLILQTMSEIDKQLQGFDFIRIHRSYIVNLAYVDLIDKDYLVIGDCELTIGKTYRNALHARLN
ncbi:LytR/AlgR family response regulator transcription factor [Shewanella cyperi]|uniref:LytR/AlgR family response regulator transcription factor n=1 Tax=Shewanella cyperi TaxID=2814292 RepID=UPI001A94F54A|nr:LytTR family DNA-binding domain-containing protein [Shewanella cyperi]QSX40706.1 response regulator transcription factor [Shewanella cyperi]